MPNSQVSLIIGIQIITSALTAIDMHLRTNRLIAKIDRMLDKPGSVGTTEYQRQREEEIRIFEERVRQTYLPMSGS